VLVGAVGKIRAKPLGQDASSRKRPAGCQRGKQLVFLLSGICVFRTSTRGLLAGRGPGFGASCVIGFRFERWADSLMALGGNGVRVLVHAWGKVGLPWKHFIGGPVGRYSGPGHNIQVPGVGGETARQISIRRPSPPAGLLRRAGVLQTGDSPLGPRLPPWPPGLRTKSLVQHMSLWPTTLMDGRLIMTVSSGSPTFSTKVVNTLQSCPFGERLQTGQREDRRKRPRAGPSRQAPRNDTDWSRISRKRFSWCREGGRAFTVQLGTLDIYV
jgi:hypothetical protein